MKLLLEMGKVLAHMPDSPDNRRARQVWLKAESFVLDANMYSDQLETVGCIPSALSDSEIALPFECCAFELNTEGVMIENHKGVGTYCFLVKEKSDGSYEIFTLGANTEKRTVFVALIDRDMDKYLNAV